uniref:Glycoprotein vIgFam4 n=1 Tax=Elephant endotheliotropic herpesvirus 1A TaxID=759753 RepID=A0A866VUP7_ELHV1|nr:glycoprotein vIgFam4 [Elephant endotheliotropic herpesvirus 1A]QOE74991.1 glycoprotein vIgFam4 [Elephant endotheliotropic herpesvirus 1A]
MEYVNLLRGGGLLLILLVIESAHIFKKQVNLHHNITFSAVQLSDILYGKWTHNDSHLVAYKNQSYVFETWNIKFADRNICCSIHILNADFKNAGNYVLTTGNTVKVTNTYISLEINTTGKDSSQSPGLSEYSYQSNSACSRVILMTTVMLVPSIYPIINGILF